MCDSSLLGQGQASGTTGAYTGGYTYAGKGMAAGDEARLAAHLAAERRKLQMIAEAKLRYQRLEEAKIEGQRQMSIQRAAGQRLSDVARIKAEETKLRLAAKSQAPSKAAADILRESAFAQRDADFKMRGWSSASEWQNLVKRGMPTTIQTKAQYKAWARGQAEMSKQQAEMSRIGDIARREEKAAYRLRQAHLKEQEEAKRIYARAVTTPMDTVTITPDISVSTQVTAEAPLTAPLTEKKMNWLPIVAIGALAATMLG